MSEWTKGFISGLFATLIGFMLTVLWETFKSFREKRQKDKIVRKLIVDVLTENIATITEINIFLEQELLAIQTRQSIVTNMTILNSDIWDLVKFHIPDDLLKSNEMLKRLQAISGKVKRINESIHSRESYRLSNQAMDNYSRRLKIYDELIMSENTKLLGLIDSFLTDYQKK
jgi:hypothetical protein